MKEIDPAACMQDTVVLDFSRKTIGQISAMQSQLSVRLRHEVELKICFKSHRFAKVP